MCFEEELKTSKEPLVDFTKFIVIIIKDWLKKRSILLYNGGCYNCEQSWKAKTMKNIEIWRFKVEVVVEANLKCVHMWSTKVLQIKPHGFIPIRMFGRKKRMQSKNCNDEVFDQRLAICIVCPISS